MLHTLNRVLDSNEDWQLVTKMLAPDDAVLLYEQGVRMLQDSALSENLQAWHAAEVKLYCLQPDCAEYNAPVPPSLEGVVNLATYEDFVDLVINNASVQAL